MTKLKNKPEVNKENPEHIKIIMSGIDELDPRMLEFLTQE